jgi:bacteriorhodopsin
MALGSQPYKPLGKFFDIIWVHYADWVIATPMLLIDLGMLAGMPVPEVFFICFMDILMIGSGYAAHISTDYRAAWPLFAFGCLCEVFILGSLLMHLYAIQQEKAGSAEAKTFTFLALWTITLWSAYPVLFALSYTHVRHKEAAAQQGLRGLTRPILPTTFP